MDNGCSAPTKTDNGIMRFGAQDNGIMRFGAQDNGIMRFGAQDNGIMKVPISHAGTLYNVRDACADAARARGRLRHASPRDERIAASCCTAVIATTRVRGSCAALHDAGHA